MTREKFAVLAAIFGHYCMNARATVDATREMIDAVFLGSVAAMGSSMP